MFIYVYNNLMQTFVGKYISDLCVYAFSADKPVIINISSSALFQYLWMTTKTFVSDFLLVLIINYQLIINHFAKVFQRNQIVIMGRLPKNIVISKRSGHISPSWRE